jgi:ankyrin repeat protein
MRSEKLHNNPIGRFINQKIKNSKERIIMSILKKIVLLLLVITVFTCAKERSPLHQAIVKQNLEKVTLLIESGADIEELDYVRTPLMRAVSSQNLEIVKYLISKKANVHYVNKFGHTMLHVAAMSKNPKVFEYMLSFNLDINRLDKRGGSVLNTAMKYVALQGKGVENLKLVLSQKDGAKHINLIKNGYTPLMVACENKEVVKLLIQYGADVTIKNKRGRKIMVNLNGNRHPKAGSLGRWKEVEMNRLYVEVQNVIKN